MTPRDTAVGVRLNQRCRNGTASAVQPPWWEQRGKKDDGRRGYPAKKMQGRCARSLATEDTNALLCGEQPHGIPASQPAAHGASEAQRQSTAQCTQEQHRAERRRERAVGLASSACGLCLSGRRVRRCLAHVSPATCPVLSFPPARQPRQRKRARARR